VSAASVSARDLGVVFLVATIGAAPAAWSADPIAILAWLALWSLPAGFLCGASGLPLWPSGLAVPGVWMGTVALVDAVSNLDLPRPIWGVLVVSGLFAAGLGSGAFLGARQLWRGSAACLLIAALAAGLPHKGGLAGEAWAPETGACLLDLSPVTLVVESAGVDWMRHSAVYEPVGTSSIGPDLRTAWRGFLAGPTVLLVGCTLALLGRRRFRVRQQAG
jgi:hypothetical protein